MRSLKNSYNNVMYNKSFPNTKYYLGMIITDIMGLMTIARIGYSIDKNYPYKSIVIFIFYISLILGTIFVGINFNKFSKIHITNNIRKDIYTVFFRAISLFGIIFVGLFKLYNMPFSMNFNYLIVIAYSSFLTISLTFTIILLNNLLRTLINHSNSKYKIKVNKHKQKKNVIKFNFIQSILLIILVIFGIVSWAIWLVVTIYVFVDNINDIYYFFMNNNIFCYYWCVCAGITLISLVISFSLSHIKDNLSHKEIFYLSLFIFIINVALLIENN